MTTEVAVAAEVFDHEQDEWIGGCRVVARQGSLRLEYPYGDSLVLRLAERTIWLRGLRNWSRLAFGREVYCYLDDLKTSADGSEVTLAVGFPFDEAIRLRAVAQAEGFKDVLKAWRG